MDFKKKILRLLNTPLILSSWDRNKSKILLLITSSKIAGSKEIIYATSIIGGASSFIDHIAEMSRSSSNVQVLVSSTIARYREIP